MVGPGGGVLLLVVLTGLVFSEEPAVTKLDGETVTLHLNQTEPRFKDYLWTYGRHNPVLAITIVTQGKVTPVNGTRFGNRLQTNIETASITISNLTVNDSGIFLAQILTETGTLLQRFNLTVQDNSVIFEKVLEGNSATLDPGIETLQKDHTVRWTKGPDFDGTLIAQWKDSKIFINETFKDVLQLNERTGALTINRMTRSLEGFYCVKNLWGTDPHILRKYLVMVYKLVPKPQISSAPANFTQTDGICSVSCSARNAPEVFLSWYQGEKKIIEISDSDISVNLTLPLQIQSQPAVIYICRAANPVSDATVTLNSTDWCPPHHSDHQSMFWILVATVVVVAVVAFLILIICLYKRSNRQGAQGM
uniref:Ig-like domain-containing protein n=1 Tax=Amphiprion percula TaxID=161767 RepID=A0A3P8TAW4_AMPPE